MNISIKNLLLLLLIKSCLYSQSISEKLTGEWLLKTDYEAPDVIVIRSDKKYFVYNDMDFMRNENRSDVIFDDGSETALTEIGKWNYNLSTRQIIFYDRSFIKNISEFNGYYGKSKKLSFLLKKITEKELILCPLSKNDKRCDTYIKNGFYVGEHTYYKEIIESRAGIDNWAEEIPLSGYETELKVEYEFYNKPIQLIIEKRNKMKLFSSTTSAMQNKVITIPLKGVTKLIFRIETKENNSKWGLNINIK